MPFDCPKLVLKKSIETLNKYINPFWSEIKSVKHRDVKCTCTKKKFGKLYRKRGIISKHI